MGDMVLKINTIFPMKPSGMTTCLNDSIVDMVSQKVVGWGEQLYREPQQYSLGFVPHPNLLLCFHLETHCPPLTLSLSHGGERGRGARQSC